VRYPTTIVDVRRQKLMSVRDITSNLVTNASIRLICLISCGSPRESFTD